jgi:hypothetical protein
MLHNPVLLKRSERPFCFRNYRATTLAAMLVPSVLDVLEITRAFQELQIPALRQIRLTNADPRTRECNTLSAGYLSHG